MNKNPQIYWKLVFTGMALFVFSGFLLKNHINGPGTGLMILGNIIMYYGFIVDFLRFFEKGVHSLSRNQNNSEITHTHNHYVYDTRSNVVEGTESTEFRPDGSSTTTRHIRKWN